jgi:hypothetical protein
MKSDHEKMPSSMVWPSWSMVWTGPQWVAMRWWKKEDMMITCKATSLSLNDYLLAHLSWRPSFHILPTLPPRTHSRKSEKNPSIKTKDFVNWYFKKRDHEKVGPWKKAILHGPWYRPTLNKPNVVVEEGRWRTWWSPVTQYVFSLLTCVGALIRTLKPSHSPHIATTHSHRRESPYI